MREDRVVEYIVEATITKYDAGGDAGMLYAITEALSEYGIIAYVYQKETDKQP